MNYQLGWQKITTSLKSQPQYFPVEVIQITQKKAKIRVESSLYTINTSDLYPRDQTFPDNLLQLKYPNHAEVARCINGRVITLAHNFLVFGLNYDLPLCSQSIKFYSHILSRSALTFKPQIILSFKDTNHNHIAYVFESIRLSSGFWPYRINPNNISKIVRSLFNQYPVQIRIKFVQNIIAQVNIQPLILRHKYNELLVKSLVEKETTYDYPTTSEGKIIADSLIGINIPIPIIRKIFRIFSGINLFEKLKVEQYSLGHQRALRLCPEYLSKISILLGISQETLQKIVMTGYNLQQKSKIQLKLRIVRVIWFQQLLIMICHLINEKLTKKQQNKQLPTNQLVFYSSGTQIVDTDASSFQNEFLNQLILNKIQQTNIKDSDHQSFPTQKSILQKLKRTESSINQHAIMIEQSYYQQYSNVRKSSEISQALNQSIGTQFLHKEITNIPEVFHYSKNTQFQYNFVINDIKSYPTIVDSLVNQITKQKLLIDPQLINIDIHTFANTYPYSNLLKRIHRIHKNIDLPTAIKNSPKQYKIINQSTQVSLTHQLFYNLQSERSKLKPLVKRIINQYRIYRFRNSINKTMHTAYRKIKFHKKMHEFILKTQYSYFKQIKQRAAIDIFENLTFNKIRTNQKYVFKLIKQNISIRQIQNKIQKLILKMKTFCLKRIKKQSGCKKIMKLLEKKIKHQQFKVLMLIKDIVTIGKIQQFKLRQQARKQQIKVQLQKQPQIQTAKKSNQTPHLKEEQLTIKKNINVEKQEQKEQKEQKAIQYKKMPVPPYKQALRIQTSEPSIPGSILNTPVTPVQINFILPVKGQNPSVIITPPINIKQSVNEELKIQNKQKSDHLSIKSKKSKDKDKISQRSENVIQISRIQLQKIMDTPKFNLEEWSKRVKRQKQLKQPPLVSRRIFSKYETNKYQVEPQENIDILDMDKIDEGLKARISVHPFFAYVRKNVRTGGDEVIKSAMCHQKVQLKEPLLSFYPIAQYPKQYLQCFNSILKIGKDKNSTKKLWELLNIVVAPINQSYQKEHADAENIFQDEPTLYSDYSSPHNIIKDQIFLYFLKQLLSNPNEQSMERLVEALTIITRYYHPSPVFIYEFLNCMQNIYINTNFKEIEEALENTLIMAKALQGNKGTELRIYQNQNRQIQSQLTEILYLRKSPFTESNIDNPTIKVCLLNNQAFTYKVRNESIRTIKNKMLVEIGLRKSSQDFGIYIHRGSSKSKNISRALIPDNTKAIDLISSLSPNQILYLKIKNYFPFSVKNLYVSRIVYLNMVHDEYLMPWKFKEYQMLVASSMVYDEFDEIRIANYLKISKQSQSKQPNMDGIQQAFSKLASISRQKRICEIQYFKYMKEVNFFLAKAYVCKNNMLVLIKPLQLNLYENNNMICSIELSRITNVFLQKQSVVCEMISDWKQSNKIRSLTLFPQDNIRQLYDNILNYVQALE